MTDRRTKQQVLDENDELRDQIKHMRLVYGANDLAPEALALSKCIKALEALEALDRSQPARPVAYGASQPAASTVFVIRALMSKYRVAEGVS